MNTINLKQNSDKLICNIKGMCMDISVIAPVYNVSQYLSEFITSVLSQSHSDFELILINDGSTDDSLQICNEFAQMDSRICVVTQENKGVSSARNKGLSVASGKWISFVDPDDKLHRDFLKRIIEIAEKSTAELIQTYCEQIDNFGNIIPYKPFYIGEKEICAADWLEKTAYYFVRNVSLPRTVLYKTSIIKKNNIWFNENYQICEDVDFVFKYAKCINKVFIDNSKFYYYRLRPRSLTKTQGINRSRFSAILYYRDAKIFFPENKSVLNGYLFGELKILEKFYLEEICLPKNMELQASRIKSVESFCVLVYGKEIYEQLSNNLLLTLRRLIKLIGIQIDWNDGIPVKQKLCFNLIKSFPLFLHRILARRIL